MKQDAFYVERICPEYAAYPDPSRHRTTNAPPLFHLTKSGMGKFLLCIGYFFARQILFLPYLRYFRMNAIVLETKKS